MRVLAEPMDLRLKRVFRISRASVSVAQNVLVRVRHDGVEGLGEAAPVRFYGQTRDACAAAARRMGEAIAARDPFALEPILAVLRRRFAKQPSAIAALDVALHDWIGKRLGVPLWKLWGLDPAAAPQTSLTIGLGSPAEVAEKIAEADAFPILKVKLGVRDDLEIMREVRRLAPRKRLRVDANCGWTVREAIAKSRALERLDVEFVEQPVPRGDPRQLARVRDAIGLPVMADESSLTVDDVLALRGCVDGVNVKLVKCGGLREALRMIHVAKACGMRVMLGCMIESSVLITAAAHLAPLADYADLDGNLLIADDPFRGVTLDRAARLVLPDAPGLGVRAVGAVAAAAAAAGRDNW